MQLFLVVLVALELSPPHHRMCPVAKTPVRVDVREEQANKQLGYAPVQRQPCTSSRTGG